MKPKTDHSDSLEEKYVFLKNQVKRLLEGKFIEPSALLDEEINQSIQKFKEQKDALKESEQKYRSLYENAPIAFQSLNENGEFIDVNPAWLSKLGYEKEEVHGKKLRDFLHPDWQSNFDVNFSEFKKRGYVSDVELKIRHKNGNYLHISFEGCMATHPDGSFKQSYCVFNDITRQKTIEESLRINQYYLSKAQELGKIGTWELDLVNNILTWTKENYKVFGVPYGTEMNYEKFLEVVHPDDREFVDKAWAKGVRINDYDIEHRLLINGEVKWVREKAHIKYDSDGNPVSAIGFTQEISKFKEVENRIKQEKEKFKILADNTFDWEYWIDPNGNYIYLSPACERITGYKPENFIENPNFLFEITIPEYKKQVENHYKSITEKDPHTEEFVILNKNDEEIWIEHSCIPVYDGNGNFRGRRGTNRDITEFKRAEKEIYDSEKKYRSLFENVGEGHALHQVICDDSGEVIDYITLLVNEKYEEYLNVSKNEIIGKKASNFLPNKELKKWIKIFGEVALNGSSKKYDLYSESNKKHFEGIAYCPEKGKFAVSFSDVTEQKQLEEIARQQGYFLNFINSIAIPSADKSSVDELSKILLKAVKDYTGAVLATFSYYQSDKKELTLLNAEADQKLLKTILKIAGEDITKIVSPVDDETYELITKSIVGKFNSFTEVTFGAIPKIIDKAIRASTGIDCLFPIAHVVDGELYGTTMLAFKKGQEFPSTELLESYAHLMSVSLKRYKAENALKESEIKFRNLFNSMQEGVYLHQMVYNNVGKAIDYRIIEANDISEKILNIKKKDAVGQLATNLFRSKEAPFLDIYSKVAETGVPVTFDQYFEPMDRHFLISAFSPKKGQFATAFTDITQQKKNEQEIIKAKENAEENEAKFRELFSSVNDAIFTYDPDTYKILDANEATSKIYGYSHDELIGMSCLRLSAEVEESKKVAEEIRNKNRIDVSLRHHKKKDGTDLYLQLSTFKISVNGKNIFYSVCHDITNIKNAEVELIQAKENAEESEKRFQLFVNQSPSPLAVVDKKLEKILYWSQSATQKLGHSPKTVSEWYNVAYPDPIYREKVIKKWNKKLKKAVKSQQATNTGEYVVTCKDGSVITVEFYVQLLPDQIIITLNDITERKRFEEDLSKSEENLKSIVENGTNMFYKHDVNHKLKYVSPQVKNILGYEVEEMMLRWTELVTDNPINEKGYEYTMKAIETGERQDVYDLELKHKNGSKILVEVREAPIVRNGKTVEIVGALADVTEQRKTENALRIAKEKAEESEKKLRVILENSTDIIALADTKGKILNINKVENSYKIEDVVGTYVTDFLGEEDSRAFKKCVQQAIKTNLPQSYYPCIITPSGDETYWHNKVKAWKTGSNKTMLTINFSDITNLKLYEKQLVSVTENLKKTFNISPAIIGKANLNTGYFVEVSMAVERILGYTPEEFISIPIIEFIHPEDRQRTLDEISEQLKGKETLSFENRYRCKNGLYKWMSWVGTSADEEGIVTAIGSSIDERKKVENEIISEKERAEENERKLYEAQDIAQVGSWDWTVETDTVSWSSTLYKLVGYDPKHSAPPFKEQAKLYTPESFRKLQKAVNRCLKKGLPYELELEMIRNDKSIIDVLIRGRVNKDEYGKVVGLHGTVLDISKHKKLENELIKAKEKAEESDRLKSAFLANMSHEIRTPMNGILGFSNLLKEPYLTGKQQQHYIEIIQKSGDRMLNTVNDIIEISKIETGLVTISTERVNINKHLSTLYHFFKLEADNKGLELIVDKQLPEEDCRTIVDKSKFSSILTNLIKNAIKFTYEGTISFGCEKKGEMLEFFVKDTGVGIPQMRQEAIFNRFEQADIKDTRVFEGSGLGLTIAKSYVEMLGGRIWVKSVEGEGSTFFFTIPATKPEPNKIDSFKTEKPASDKNRKLVFLVVEDDEVSKIHMSLLLKDTAERIIEASNGLDAIEAVKNNPEIDIVLMDIRMSRMNGLKATQKIREFNKDIVIIAQTAFALEGDREKLLKAGCTDYISKPINKEKLLTLIEKYS